MPLSNKLEPGKLQQRIEIVKPSGAQDSFGGISQDPTLWTSVLSCWASVEAATGRDQLAAGQFAAVTSHKITIRLPRDKEPITSAMYVWFKKRTFQISAVLNPDELSKMLYLMVVEVNNSTQQIAPPNVS